MQVERDHTRAEILGLRVSAIDMKIAIATIELWIESRTQHYICVTGVHGVMESQRDQALKDIHNAAGMVTPDGMPLVWMSHWLGFKATERVYGPDLMALMMAVSAARGYRNYFYGGGPGIAVQLKNKLCGANPGLQVVGTMCPPFRAMTEAEDGAVVRELNEAAPDIIWVGLSTPRQEKWMAAHAGRVTAPVMVGVGAAFDFLSGNKSQAPGWMQRSGLEWMYRLASEPRRLAGRDLRNNPQFVYRAALQLAATRASARQW